MTTFLEIIFFWTILNGCTHSKTSEKLSISVWFCLFQSISVWFCMFLSVSVRFNRFLSVSVSFCQFLSVSVSFYPFLSVSVHVCLVLWVFACFCLFWTEMIRMTRNYRKGFEIFKKKNWSIPTRSCGSVHNYLNLGPT